MKVGNRISYFLSLQIFCLLIKGSLSAKGEGNCELIDEDGRTISPYEWDNGVELNPINDTLKNDTVLRRYKSKNVGFLYDFFGILKKLIYISTEMEGDYFVIKTGRDIDKYEENETSTEIKISAEFQCYNYRYSQIEFRIRIIDSNNHDPEFLNEPYQFTLPLPMRKGFDLDPFKKIIARDVDLTNKQITFSFDQNEQFNKRFLVSSLGQDPKDIKNYLTKLATSTMIELEDDLTLTLFATDSGNPPRTKNTTVKIIIDKKDSSPRFAQPLYVADLTNRDIKNADKILLQFAEGNVTLTRGYQELHNFEIRGISEENKKHFKLTHSGAMSNDGLITYVTLNNLTEEFIKQKIITILLAAVNNHIETTTVLQILLPSEVFNSEPGKVEIIQEGKSPEHHSTNGYMAATIILSLTSVGLSGYIIFLYLRK